MDVAIARSGTDRRDGPPLRLQHQLVKIALRGGEAARDRPGARDVAGPAAVGLCADVGQQQIAVPQVMVVALAVQDLAVGRNNRWVSAAHPARDERRLHGGPDGGRGAPRAGGRHAGAVGGGRRFGGSAQLGHGGLVVLQAEGDHRVGEWRVEHVNHPGTDLAVEQAALLETGLDIGRGQRGDGAPRTLAARRATGRTGQAVAAEISSKVGGGPSQSA